MKRPSPALFLSAILPVLVLAGLSGAQSTTPADTNQPASTAAQQPGTSDAAPPANAPAAPPAEPQAERPVTTRFPDEAGTAEVDALLKPAPLPKEKVTLIGGTVRKIDRIRNRLDVNIFGGKRMRFEFDERTRIFRDGTEVTSMGVKDGDRVYVDSQLDDNRKIFARNVHVVTNLVPAEATGQITRFDIRNGRMTLHDQLSSRPITFMLTPETRITDSRGTVAADVKQLLPGALVEVGFAPAKGARGRRAVAEQVKLIAALNSDHLFEGAITHVDMRSGILAIRNERDNRTYDLSFDPMMTGNAGEIRVGMKATAKARYTGQDYRVLQLRLHEEARADADEERSQDSPEDQENPEDQEKKNDEDDEEKN